MHTSAVMALLASIASLSAAALPAQTSVFTTGEVRVEVAGEGASATETISLRSGERWIPALAALSSPMRVRTASGFESCTLARSSKIARGLLLEGACGSAGKYEQRIVETAESDVLEVSSRFTAAQEVLLRSVEDRYSFLPPRRSVDTAHEGPLDFIWSQNIKSEPDDLIPTGGFKSPALMLQQGEVFTALLPHVNLHHPAPLALDLDVTTEKQPWISFGAIPSEPHGHSYFRRSADQQPTAFADTVSYSYSLVLSRQPAKLGYRRVVRKLWRDFGHPALLASADAQRNVLRPELTSFDAWRQEAWHTYADRVYRSVPCAAGPCGTLASNRSVGGHWKEHEPDAWFNAWFQTLRTAYGWYLYGRQTNDTAMQSRADSVLNLALSAPQKDGAFPTIYLAESKRWFPDDGWAGYPEDYHAFCMSWTAYWMLKWAADLTPNRRDEILRFTESYGDFLLHHQLASGVIPSWYTPETLAPREEFRDFNAETAASALFLVTLGTATGKREYTAAAERAMNFITEELVPRQRWFDFETYLSCARKDYGFYDRWTAQFPQNNLAEIQAPQAWLALYHATGKRIYLDRGEQALDHLLLTQQVWTNPSFTPNLLGGFTTQNTDAEWSDARQGYAATVLFDYYQQTGTPEYLERSVAAARSTFAVAPWENWAHTGYKDEQGAMTGFHWGTGSAMTSVEIMSPTLGDAFIDLGSRTGVGFDECTIRDVETGAHHVSFQLDSPNQERTFMVRFRGVDPHASYTLSANGAPPHTISGRELMAHGYRVQASRPGAQPAIPNHISTEAHRNNKGQSRMP